MIHLVLLEILACGDPGMEGGVTELPDRPTAVVAAASEGCPYWYLAPCGEDFDHKFVCEPCREQAYACSTGGDPRLDRWGESGIPCECIDPKTGTVMDWKPECIGSTD